MALFVYPASDAGLAGTRHPDDVSIDAAVQITALVVLQREGVEPASKLTAAEL